MICSMTGYGSAESAGERWTVRAEVRSVNQRDLRTSIRLPDTLRLREADLARLVQGKLARGHVHLSVRCTLAEEALDLLVDRERLRGYLRLAREVAAEEDVPLRVEAGALMSMPGVIGSDALPASLQEELWPQVIEAAESALADMISMRQAEGRNLARAMADICDRLLAATEALEGRIDECIAHYQDRLAERVKRLLARVEVPAEPDVLAREVAFLAERSDIAEEVARLKSHVAQFRSALDGDGEPVGKKLEFLVQEMLREANTMAAKVPSSDLAQVAVEIKADVNRLREQALNVE